MLHHNKLFKTFPIKIISFTIHVQNTTCWRRGHSNSQEYYSNKFDECTRVRAKMNPFLFYRISFYCFGLRKTKTSIKYVESCDSKNPVSLLY